MENLSPVIMMALALFIGYLILRPFVTSLFSSKSKKKPEKKYSRMESIQFTALEIAALASLMIKFPYAQYGVNSFMYLLAFVLGLAFVPSIARPLIGFYLALIAFLSLESDAAMKLLLLIGTFLFLRLVKNRILQLLGFRE